jgi:hypothetical protein
MRKLLLGIAVVFLAGCGNGIGNAGGSGTYAPYTGATVGPGWFAGSGTLSICDLNNVQVASITTDSTGHGTISLPAASYWIQPTHLDSATRPDSALKEHTITITSGEITRDTINFCPECV